MQSVSNVESHPTHLPTNNDTSHVVPTPSVHDFENEALRKKLQALREDNAQLVSGNHKLLGEVESLGYELHTTQNQLQAVNQELESTRGEVPSLREKVQRLESSIRLDDEALRSADDKLQQIEHESKERNSELKQTREEAKAIKSELTYEMQQRKRAENQRDEALQNLDELSDQLNEYRVKTKDKFKKHQSTEDHLRDSLLHCDKEREDLLEKATSLEGELQDAREMGRTLKEESLQAAQTTTHNLESVIAGLTLKSSRLEEQLDEKERQNRDLKELTDRQNERLADCQRDAEVGRVELKRLEEMAARLQERTRNSGDASYLHAGYDIPRPIRASSPASDPGTAPGHRDPHRGSGIAAHGDRKAVSADNSYDTSWSEDREVSGLSGSNKALVAELRMKLAMKEAENQRLQATRQRETAGVSPPMGSGTMDGLRSELTSLVEKNKIGDRKAHELGSIIGRLEDERTRHASQLVRLQERLTAQEEHGTAVESQLDHYNAQLRLLNGQIEAKEERAASLESELERKASLVAHLEEHLSEKTASIDNLVSRLAEVEDELEMKTTDGNNLRSNLKKKSHESEELTKSLTKVKGLHAEHCQEMQQQIESLQEIKGSLTSQLQDARQSLDSLQKELRAQVTHSEQLNAQLDLLKKEMDERSHEYLETTEKMRSKVTQDEYRIGQLEAALIVCKEELTGYIEKLDDARERYEQELDAKKSELRKFEKLLKQSRDEMDRASKRSSQLEQALGERLGMLQQSTARLSELEDKEGQLEHQVSHLEKGLTHVTTAAERDAALIEKKLHQACVDLEERASQYDEATASISKLQTELAESSSRSADLDRQLNQTRKDCDNHAAKATQLDVDLREAKLQLEQKTEKVSDLEAALLNAKDENSEYRERSQELDGELRKAQLELQTTGQQLSELQRLLQRSRAESKQKQQRMQELNQELRRSRGETRERDQDMAEMDEALKNSQRELQQRASQVGQLDMVVKEHQSESEQRILQLEATCSKNQYELQQRNKKISELDEQCEEQQSSLAQRALQVQQQEQTTLKLKNDLECKALEIEQLHKRIEDLTNQCHHQREDDLAQGQQLRLTREQMQRHHLELTEAKRQLAQEQREKERLARELEDAAQLLHARDMDHARLAEEHGAIMAREAETETRFGAELERIGDLQQREMDEKEHQLSQLREGHAALLAAKNQLEAGHRLEMSRLKEAEARSRQEEVASLRDRVRDLDNELWARKDVIEAANEAIVIKEAEVARLNARVSGYERASSLATPSSNSPSPPRRPRSSAASVPYLVPSLLPQSPLSPGTVLRRTASDLYLSTAGLTSTSFQSDTTAKIPSSPVRGNHPPNAPHQFVTKPSVDSRGRGKADRNLADTGYQSSRGLYGSEDFHQPPTTQTSSRYNSTRLNEPARVRHFSDADSVEDDTIQTFQGMLAFVNQSISGRTRLTLEDSGMSPLADGTDGGDLSGITLDLSELDATGRDRSGEARWTRGQSPRKAVRRGRSSSAAGQSNGLGVVTPPRSTLHDSAAARLLSPGLKGNTSSHRPKIMKSTGQLEGDSPHSIPLKKRLSAQRAKMATSKSSANSSTTEAPLKPEDCMANLQDRLRANDERRRRIDNQLYNMRDHARKITNRILAND